MKRFLAALGLLLALAAPALAQQRTLYTSDVSFYVSPDGNDSYDCANSIQPCATLQHIWDQIGQFIDLGGHTITIQMADGIYAGGITTATAPTGGGTVNIQGNASDSTAVQLQCGPQSCFSFVGPTGTAVRLSNLTTGVTDNTLPEVHVSGQITLYLTAHNFTGGGKYGLLVEGSGSYAEFDTAPWTFGGTFGSAVVKAYKWATVQMDATTTITTVPTSWSVGFVWVDFAILTSYVVAFPATGGGSFTGSRFKQSNNGIIETFGQQPNLFAAYFPGNANGSGLVE